MTFIKDKEMNLHEEDILQTKPYAESLKNTILNAPTPFNIGLYGEWGSGKSSIISTVQKELENSENPKIKFVVYDAWKYANDSFRRMFLKTLQEELKFDGSELFDSFYQNTTQDKKIEQKFNWKYLLLILVFGFGSILLTFFFFKTDNQSTIITLQSILTIMTALIAFFKNAFVDYKLTISKPAMFAPEQFEDAFKEIVTWSFHQKNLLPPYKWIKEKSIFEKPIEKLIIIIDNIDRCDRKTAYDLLTNIKNFVSEDQKIIFLVPVDDEALKRHMQEHNKENGKEADEFLRKFFNTTVKIKHFQPRDLFEYADSLNQKYNLGFNPDTINIVAKEYASNPRRIIQLFNNLTIELKALESKHQSEFCEKNQSLIAKLLIIREEWANIFKKITEQPHLFKEHIEIAYDKEEKNEKLEFERFKQFMQKTRAIGSDILTIEKIVLNITNESTLSTELISLVELGERENLLPELEKNNNYQKIVNFAVEELRKSYERNILSSSSNSLVLLSNLNNFKELDASTLRNIAGFFHDTSKIKNILEQLIAENVDIVVKFIETNRLNKLEYLHTLIFNQLTKEWHTTRKIDDKPKAIWLDGFISFINNTGNENTIKNNIFQDVFFNLYMTRFPLITLQSINLSKINLLPTKHIIDYLISTTIDPIDIDICHEYQELLYLGEQGLLTHENMEKLFLKIKPNFSVNTQAQNPQEEKQRLIDNIFTNIKACTILVEKVTPKSFDCKDIIGYIQEFSKAFQIIQTSNPRVILQFNLLQDISTSESYQNQLLYFYISIYKLTLGHSSILNHIVSLVNQHPKLKDNLNNDLYQITSSYQIKIEPFFNYLIKQNEINKELFNLYEKLFIEENVQKNYQDQLKLKFSTLINQLISESNQDIGTLLINLNSNKFISGLLTEIITSKSTDEMMKLPPIFKQIAYDNLCTHDTIFDYEDDLEAIKDISSFSSKYNSCILKIVKSKLLNSTKVPDAIEIINVMKDLSEDQKQEILRELKAQRKHETHGEEVKALIKKLSPQRITKSTPTTPLTTPVA